MSSVRIRVRNSDYKDAFDFIGDVSGVGELYCSVSDWEKLPSKDLGKEKDGRKVYELYGKNCVVNNNLASSSDPYVIFKV